MLKKATTLMIITLMAVSFTACTNADDNNRVERNNVNNMRPLDVDMNNRNIESNRDGMNRNTLPNQINNGVDRMQNGMNRGVNEMQDGIDYLNNDVMDGNRDRTDLNRHRRGNNTNRTIMPGTDLGR